MIRINQLADIDWDSVQAVAYGHEPIEISEQLLAKVDEGRSAFLNLIEQGVPFPESTCLIGPFGCLRRHVDSGKVTQDTIHGELGKICTGELPGRENDDETILLWHRGLSTSDIALGAAMLEKADRLGIGHNLPYA